MNHDDEQLEMFPEPESERNVQMLHLNDSLETLAAMMLGYKAKLMADGEGFSEESAEIMACQFHEVVIANVIIR